MPTVCNNFNNFCGLILKLIFMCEVIAHDNGVYLSCSF